jgi:homoserine dehydrogenase
MGRSGARRVRLVLIGAGNVGRRFLELLILKDKVLRERLGLELALIGVADSSGAAISSAGLDLQQIVELKIQGQSVAAYPSYGEWGLSALEMVQQVEADLLLEASPASMKDGQPGLACIEAALARGMHVVTANKVPLVLAFRRLRELAHSHGVRLLYDATVAGGLPAINLGQRDLAVADIHRLEGIVNLTTNYILTRMAQDGLTYDEALADAQEAGHAEADPTLDVEGWDAANKLVILAQSVLGQAASLEDVDVEGITGIEPEELKQAAASGRVIKLIARAEREDGDYRLSVRPTWLDRSHPLARLTAHQMGIVYHTDINGTIAATVVEEDPMPTAAAMLRDLINIYE